MFQKEDDIQIKINSILNNDHDFNVDFKMHAYNKTISEIKKLLKISDIKYENDEINFLALITRLLIRTSLYIMDDIQIKKLEKEILMLLDNNNCTISKNILLYEIKIKKNCPIKKLSKQ